MISTDTIGGSLDSRGEGGRFYFEAEDGSFPIQCAGTPQSVHLDVL